MAYSSIKVANAFRDLSGGNLTPLQLIKLVYIAHGWSLAIYDRSLINEDVRAWQYGPVIPQLYNAIKKYRAEPVKDIIPGDNDKKPISEEDRQLISVIYEKYGNYSGGQLSTLTHKPHSPWSQTWNEHGENQIIQSNVISEHYKKLKDNQIESL